MSVRYCISAFPFRFLLVRVRDSTQLWSSFNFFLSQAVVLFMAGKHVNTMVHMDDFITDRAAWAANPVLLGMGHDDDAIAAFEMMLLKMSESSDLEIRDEGNHIILKLFP